MIYNQDLMRINNTSDYKRRGYGRHDSNPTALKNIAYQKAALAKHRSQMNTNANKEMLLMDARRGSGNYGGYSGVMPDFPHDNVRLESEVQGVLPFNLLTEGSESNDSEP